MAVQGGFGLKVKIKITSTMTVIANVLEAEFPEFERTLADVTAHDSSGGWAQFISTGKRMLNEFSMTLLWDKAIATHTAIITAFNSETAVDMSIEDPTAAETIAFKAFIKTIGRVGEQEEGFTCEVTVQPTGAPTITP